MSFAGILALAIVLVLLGTAVGLVLLARFLTSETDADQELRFDPFAPRHPQPLLWLPEFLRWWRRRPRRLTYRRDWRGRFRKYDR